MKKIMSSLLALCFLVSCQAPVSESGEKVSIVSSSSSEEYNVMVPIDMNEAREFHEQRQSSSEDFGNMGEQLIALSKEYFNPSEYVLGEGSVITYDDLMKLRRRESETNEMGLNPSTDTIIPSGSDDVTIIDPVLISDVVEQNFYKEKDGEYVLSGISIALYMTPKQDAQTKNGKIIEKTLSDDIMFDYGSTMARKLERFLRTKDKAKKLPILITLYVKGVNDSYVPGYMLGKGYFLDRSPNFERLNQKWYLFPSNEAKKMDITTYDEFSNFKTALSNFIVDDVGIVGFGFFKDNELKNLNITVKYTPKTYVEYMTIVNYSAKLLESMTNEGYDIRVEFKNLSETVAIVLKNSGNRDSQIVYLSW